jgi:hypothetical protein
MHNKVSNRSSSPPIGKKFPCLLYRRHARTHDIISVDVTDERHKRSRQSGQGCSVIMSTVSMAALVTICKSHENVMGSTRFPRTAPSLLHISVHYSSDSCYVVDQCDRVPSLITQAQVRTEISNYVLICSEWKTDDFDLHTCVPTYRLTVRSLTSLTSLALMSNGCIGQ